MCGTDPTGYDCQEDKQGAVESACLISNDGVNKITDANGKTLGTVIAANKGDQLEFVGNGGTFLATFTGMAGDINMRSTAALSADIGWISKATNGTLDGTTASTHSARTSRRRSHST